MDNNLNHGAFTKSLLRKQPKSLEELQEKVEKYIHLEEAMKVKTNNSKRNSVHQPLKGIKDLERKLGHQGLESFLIIFPLNVSLNDIYKEIFHTKRLPQSNPI